MELSEKGADEIEEYKLIQAERYLQQAIDQKPSLPIPYYCMGIAKGQQEEYSSAIEFLAKGLEIAGPGERPGFLIAVGDINVTTGEYQSAIEAYTEALKHAMPTNGTKNGQAYCYYARGEANRLLGNHADAISDLRKAERLTKHAVENDPRTTIERTPAITSKASSRNTRRTSRS